MFQRIVYCTKCQPIELYIGIRCAREQAFRKWFCWNRINGSLIEKRSIWNCIHSVWISYIVVLPLNSNILEKQVGSALIKSESCEFRVIICMSLGCCCCCCYLLFGNMHSVVLKSCDPLVWRKHQQTKQHFSNILRAFKNRHIRCDHVGLRARLVKKENWIIAMCDIARLRICWGLNKVSRRTHRG